MTALTWLACTTSATPESSSTRTVPTIPVLVEEVQVSEAGIPLQVTGMLAAQEEMRLGFKIGGVIQAIYVGEGETVRKGQQLARLNSIEIDAQVSQARSAVEKSKRDLARVTQLYADSVATLEQVQDLTTALEVAEASLEGATYNQGQSIIYAPASGQIVKQFGETGEVIGPGTPILLLASQSKNKVLRTGLSDVEVVQVSLGDKAEIVFDALPSQRFPAKVSQIAAGSDPYTGTFEVELQLSQSSTALKNGFIGKASILPHKQASYAKLPMQALVEADAERAVIFVPDASQTLAQKVIIQQYSIQDDFLAIPVSELQEHRFIITEGAKYLSPDAPIEVVKEPLD